jgi:hypothetical protein
VKWDINVCFYIELKQRSGHAFHVSHTKLIDPNLVAVPTHLLTSDQIDNIVHVVNATSNNGCACNYIHGKFGKFISLMKVAYLCRRENGDLNSPRDDIDQMMDHMAMSDEISCVSLSDVPIKDYFDVNNTDCNVDTMTISTTKSFTGHVHYESINESSEISSLSTQINEERSKWCLQKGRSTVQSGCLDYETSILIVQVMPRSGLGRCNFPLQQQGISYPYFLVLLVNN